jgi:hypothetical protein
VQATAAWTRHLLQQPSTYFCDDSVHGVRLYNCKEVR